MIDPMVDQYACREVGNRNTECKWSSYLYKAGAFASLHLERILIDLVHVYVLVAGPVVQVCGSEPLSSPTTRIWVVLYH